MRNALLLATLPIASFVWISGCGGNVTSEPGATSATPSSAATSGQGGGDATSSAAVGGGSATSVTTTATSATSSSSNSGPGGGPPDEGCPAIATLMLDSAALSDAGGDGIWSPGEDATLSATIENPTIYDVTYPGFVFASDHPEVTTNSPSDAFFVIFAASTVDIKTTFHADAAVAPGTAVTLSITMIDIQNQLCPLPAPLTLVAAIQ